ncbi:MAG: hypothetical protein OEV73_04985 [Desulfobulbaceae bacterium]|nr:hypothetical protein [Desulfobulbaceae bacterium]
MNKSLLDKGVLVALLAILTLFGLSAGQSRAATTPAFVLPNALDGAMVDSRSLSGKVVLINFFTTW